MIIINDIMIGQISLKELDKLTALLKKKLNEYNISFNMHSSDNKIWFKPLQKGKYFSSVTPNKIMLNKNNSRTKTLGRDYLNTNRLTEKQHSKITTLLSRYLNDLGITHTISFQEFEDDPASLVPLYLKDKWVRAYEFEKKPYPRGA